MCTVLFVICCEDYLNAVVNVGLIREDGALLICSLVFVLYDIQVVCDSVVAMLSSHFVIQMIVLLLFLFYNKAMGCFFKVCHCYVFDKLIKF